MKVSTCYIVETDLYNVMGEDEMLTVYDVIVEALVDGDIYHHKHVFKGHVQDPDGFEHPNRYAKDDAQRLADRVNTKGFINLEHWVLVGNLSEQEDPMDRLKREWADTSDHFDRDVLSGQVYCSDADIRYIRTD